MIGSCLRSSHEEGEGRLLHWHLSTLKDYIALCSHRQEIRYEELEDLISIGTIGLIKAIESYSPYIGTKFA
ncbi:hypothetical protein [Paenibacillus aurantius]